MRNWKAVIFAMAALCTALSALGEMMRERRLFSNDWHFQLGEVSGAESPGFDHGAWRKLDLPHDWSIESEINEAAPSTGLGGFFETGIGWYRKTFKIPGDWKGRRVAIEFEGIYRNAEVWINGVSLGKRPYGYSTVSYELTPHVRWGGENELSVRVDNSAQVNSRWYTGSGIYRHVWLEVTSPVHVAPWGVFVMTESASAESAAVRVQTTVRNTSTVAAMVKVETVFINAEKKPVANHATVVSVNAGDDNLVEAKLIVGRPSRWSVQTPTLYEAVTTLSVDGRVVDETRTTFGIRTVSVSPERGFQLNGESVKLNGANVHHDHGPLGAAAFDRAEERKVELLKAAGFNAVRTAHNPPSPAFLAACDRLGLLVMDEAFDGWARAKHKQDYSVDFKEWSQRDLEAMVRRDRNHPSVVMWSIGNEMFERGNAAGLKISEDLTAQVRMLDPTRPVTAGVNGLGKSAPWEKLDTLFATLDVAGYNYELVRAEEDHARVPGRVIVSAESYQNDVFATWQLLRERPYVIGDFVWTGMDYLGEAGIGRVFGPDEVAMKFWEASQFPWHGAACGDVDLIGQRKPISHYRNIVWDAGEKLYAAVVPPTSDGRPWNPSGWAVPPRVASWTWPGLEGRALQLEVYSRYDVVAVRLNGKLIGEQTVNAGTEFIAKFEVPYGAGTLEVVGMSGGKVRERFILKTVGAARALTLTPDRPVVKADGQDLIFVEVAAVDARGERHPQSAVSVQYRVTGPAEIVAIGSADPTSRETYQANPRRLAEGRALVVLRTTSESGEIVLEASAEGLTTGRVTVRAKK